MRAKNMLGDAGVANRRIPRPVSIQIVNPQLINKGLHETSIINVIRLSQRPVDVEDREVLHRTAKIGTTSVCIGAPVTIASLGVT